MLPDSTADTTASQKMSNTLELKHTPEPVAIIGIGCRYPGGAESPAAFWELVSKGVDAITEIPAQRWDIEAFYDKDPQAIGKMSTRWGGFLKQVDQFDPHFFKIPAREAAHIDPQQRLLLEVAWEALEDAGQVPEKLAGSRTGVFIGVMSNDYGDMAMTNPALMNFYSIPGLSYCITANRLSYFFDFRGPSMAIDTACSSSLVAVHLACQSLWSGETTLALAGGVNVILSAEGTIWYTKAGLMAADGRCKTFDARADGLVRGEGAGVLVLKPLSQAQADGDPIYAVIKGTAVNQDGRSNGLTAPSRWSQEAVIREAYHRAGVSPSQVGYVELHGTGTSLGDPIEAMALGGVLATERTSEKFCAVGSVKTNIGHLEAAAGVAGLTKVALMLKHRMIAPSLHFQKPNPHIPYETLPLRVQQTLAPWPNDTEACIAAVSSFGFGGTNAHVVLGEAPVKSASRGSVDEPSEDALLLTLSGHTAEALQAQARAVRGFLVNEGASESLSDICYTSNARRAHQDHRLSLVGCSREEFVKVLEAFTAGETHPAMHAHTAAQHRRPKTAFVFSGQGPQWWAMGRQLLAEESVFRIALEQCDEQFGAHAGWSLLEQLRADESDTRMTSTAVAQPSLFAAQVGLAALWRSWGIEPSAVVGHSMGEVSAAHVAGVLSLEDAARVIFHRSRLMERLTGHGKMAAVALGPTEAAQHLVGFEDRLAIAAHNSPASCVLSGESAALEEVLATIRQRGVDCRLLPVNYAFHSPQLRSLERELVESLDSIKVETPALSIFPTLGGEAGTGRAFDAAYWGRQMCEPVLFAEAISGLLARGFETFVEVGPHPVLGGVMRECFSACDREDGLALSSLRRGEDERVAMLKSLGALYTRGQDVQWSGINKSEGRCVSLPSYPWQRNRFWLKEQDERYRKVNGRASDDVIEKEAAPTHSLLGRRMSSAVQAQTFHWETTLDCRRLSYLKDHRVQGAVVLPAAVYVLMALSAGAELSGHESLVLEKVSFEKALVLEEERAKKVQMVVSREDESDAVFSLFSMTEETGDWTLHARGRIRSERKEERLTTQSISLEEVKNRCAQLIEGAEFYSSMARRGLEYGQSFRGVECVWRRDGEALARLRLPDSLAAQQRENQLPPALLDSCFQVLASALPKTADRLSPDLTYLPVGFKELRVHRQPGSESLLGYAVLNSAAETGALEGDVLLLDESGEVLIEVRGFRLLRLHDEWRGRPKPEADAGIYEIEWRQEAAENELAPETRRSATGKWLVLVDEGSVGRALVRKLEAAGESCVVIHRGDEYRRAAENVFYLDPASPIAFRQLLADAFGSGLEDCPGVIHLWNMDAVLSPLTAQASPVAAQVLGCDSVLHLVQALEGNGLPPHSRLWLVTSGAERTGTTDEQVALAQTPVWGLGRVIAQEYPSRRCTLVDLSHDDAASEVDALLREMRSSSGEDQIALRGDVRYVARLNRCAEAAEEPWTETVEPERQESARAGAKTTICADATYLISGGLGALGLRIAQWMVERGARHIVLIGRSAISNAARDAVAAMKKTGATVIVATADISDSEQVCALLAGLRETMPPLKGVVHAAGVVDDALLRNLDQERFARVLAPKISGAWNLHRHTLEAPLDFFVLFSSFSGLLGNAGQASYAAGNAFLDGLAHYRHLQGLPGLSINWGPWSEAGMALGREREFELQGIRSLTPEQGTEFFGRLLQSDTAQAGVLAADWSKLLSQSPSIGVRRLLADFAGEATTQAARPATSAAESKPELIVRLHSALPGKRRQLLMTHLQEEVRCVLGRPDTYRPGLQQGFFEMGMDSLMIAELGRNLQENVGHHLPLSIIIDRANIEGLADYLSRDVLALEEAVEPATAWSSDRETSAELARLELLSEDEALSCLLQKLQ